MDSTSSATPSKGTSNWRIAAVLVVVILGVGVACGWLLLKGARAKREAIAQRDMAQAARAASEDAVAAQALSNYLAKIRAQVRDHEAAFLRLKEQRALAWNIHERADLERDRRIIRDFLDTNARLTDTLQNGEGFIRAELDTAKVPAPARDSALALYAKSEGPLLPLQMRVRYCDAAIGKNALAVLDLLELSWGTWNRDDATGELEFNNTVTLATFKDYVEKIKAAGGEREEAEAELAKNQKRRPAP